MTKAEWPDGTEVSFPGEPVTARYVAVYRGWLALEPVAPENVPGPTALRCHPSH